VSPSGIRAGLAAWAGCLRLSQGTRKQHGTDRRTDASDFYNIDDNNDNDYNEHYDDDQGTMTLTECHGVFTCVSAVSASDDDDFSLSLICFTSSLTL